MEDDDKADNANTFDDDSSEEEIENQFEIAIITDLVKSPIIKHDEFSFFSQTINAMAL
jgi:hypothetical protein